MNATTMGPTGETPIPAAEAPAATGETPVPAAEAPAATGEKAAIEGHALHSIWWFGLGTVTAATVFTSHLVKTLVERGKEVEPRLSGSFKKAEEGLSGALSGAAPALKEMIGVTVGRGAQKVEDAYHLDSLLERAQAPLRQELQELAKKVDDLAAKISQLESRAEEKQPIARAASSSRPVRRPRPASPSR